MTLYLETVRRACDSLAATLHELEAARDRIAQVEAHTASLQAAGLECTAMSSATPYGVSVWVQAGIHATPGDVQAALEQAFPGDTVTPTQSPCMWPGYTATGAGCCVAYNPNPWPAPPTDGLASPAESA